MRAKGTISATAPTASSTSPRSLNTSRWAPQAAEAVRRTASEVLWFDGAPALAVYHADCGGHTSAAAEVWGGTARPYLVSRLDDGAAAEVHASWRYEATAGAVRDALNADPRTRVGPRLDSIVVVDRDAAGRAERVAIEGAEARVVRGETLREVLGASLGSRTVKSTWFDVRRDRASFVFEGRGFGHGVGLCQAGALARIRVRRKAVRRAAAVFPGNDSPHACPLRRLEPICCRRPPISGLDFQRHPDVL